MEAQPTTIGPRKSPVFTIPRFGDQKLQLYISSYHHGGNTAVEINAADESEYFGTVSVNVEGVLLHDGEFVFKTYSENEGLLEQLVAAGLVKETGWTVHVGMSGEQPICSLTPFATGEGE